MPDERFISNSPLRPGRGESAPDAMGTIIVPVPPEGKCDGGPGGNANGRTGKSDPGGLDGGINCD